MYQFLRVLKCRKPGTQYVGNLWKSSSDPSFSSEERPNELHRMLEKQSYFFPLFNNKSEALDREERSELYCD
ncbi:hypothetical protein ACET3Z_032521 [Daucus carota]